MLTTAAASIIAATVCDVLLADALAMVSIVFLFPPLSSIQPPTTHAIGRQWWVQMGCRM